MNEPQTSNQSVAEKVNESRLSTLFDTYKRNFELSDLIGFAIIVAVAVAHSIPGEMLWLRDYGASRSGKTELLRAIATHPDCTEMENITPAAIRGGLDTGHRLLERINGKLVITKDLAAILTTRRETRNEIFGLLRSLKDGSLTSDFGTEEGYLYQEVKFDWIIATTPVFAQYRQMEDLLGARYIDLNWEAPSREQMTARALENNPDLPNIREQVAKAVRRLIDRCKDMQEAYPAELTASEKELIIDWADLTALFRSPVARDKYHKVRFNPEPEVGTDLAQGFQRIAKALKILNWNVAACIARLCRDSIPYNRRQLLLKLMEEDSIASNISQFELDDMKLLGICEKGGEGYSLKPELKQRLFIPSSYW